MATVHILGAGTPTPTPTRFGSSYVVELDGQYLMVDCGPAATHKLVKAGLWPTAVDHLFFTHHHFDHDIDYPCFLLCRWDQSIGKENRLQVYGPDPHRDRHRAGSRERRGRRRGLLPRLEGPGEPPPQPARIRQPRWHPAPQASRRAGPRHRPRPCLLRPRLADDCRPCRARPALPRLSRLPLGHLPRQHRLHRRHPTLRNQWWNWPKART